MSDRPRDVLCISSIDWDFIWQGHQEIMSTLASQGGRVLFIENTGVRPPRLRDLPRLRQRLRNRMRGTGGFREEGPNLFVMSPVVVPLPYSRVARWINRVLLVRAIRRWMKATEFGRPVVWTFLPTPLAHELIRHLDPALTIYYCIDDLASSSAEAGRIVKSEKEMFRRADLVFVTSEKLRRRAAEETPRVHLFPFGVKFESFEQVRRAPREAPKDIASLPRPLVGYVGGLHQWVDQDLVVDVAGRLPGMTFVFVGPAQTDMSRLEQCPNVVLLGAKPHTELPAYVREFEVGIVPYRLSDYTENVYPTKLNEYLSMGIPVVASDLFEIRRFNAEHHDIVSVADDGAAFADAIQRAVRDNSQECADRRIEVARGNSWRSRIEKMSALIDEAVAERAQRSDRWDERLKRAYRLTRRRTLEAVAGALVVYILLFQTPLIWIVASPLLISRPPVPSDVIVVFAGGVGESGKAGGGYQERVKQAVELYRAGYAKHLIFSSGFVFAFREPDVMRSLAIGNGVPPAAIELETRATNTYENVTYSSAIAKQRGWRRVLLVSSPYHMRRAVLTWHHQVPDIEVVPTPVPASQFYAHERGASLDQIRGIAQEYTAMLVYWWRGWL